MDGKFSLKDLIQALNDTITKDDFVAAFEAVVETLSAMQKKFSTDASELRTEFESFKTKIKADNSTDIEEVKTEAMMAIGAAIRQMLADCAQRMESMQARIDAVQDGQDADEELIFERLRALLPTLADLEKNLPSFGKEFRDGLELLQGDERLDISAIKGWEKLRDEIALAQKTGKPVQFVGGARGIYLYIGGVKKGIMNTLNFVAGTGMSIAYSKVNGFDTLTFNASGSGITIETPPESPDPGGSRTQFTVSAQPKFVVADGTTYFENAGYSYDSGTSKVTMDIPPSAVIRIAI